MLEGSFIGVEVGAHDSRAAQAPKAAPQPRREKAPREKGTEEKKPLPKADGQKKSAAPAPRKEREDRKPRSHNRGRRSGPPEVTLRPGGQKDSTEQPTLMKSYYLNRED